ncbi:MAG: endonuclease/exonuclease/phosphatase family protein [Solirubrobacterales bacterium]|nr:endonuclease/exonuclease/phosphatase family protein [Solirubrobacterales bacterium]
MNLRVLTWNLMHGRSVPGSGRDLRPEFTAALADWAWDVAVLQEVPPWWPRALAAALGAEYRMVRTSRNAGLVLRRAIAIRWPDAIKSGGGGANAILARSDRIIVHRRTRLCWRPERRWGHAVQLACGVWVANLHASTAVGAARRDGRRACAAGLAWAGEAPLVLAGDFNLRDPAFPEFEVVASHDVDHVLVAGEVQAGPAEVLHRGSLSDHAPLAITVSTG